MSGFWQLICAFGKALGLTVAIEIPICLLFFRKTRRLCLRSATVCLLMNLITNPLLNLILLLTYRAFGGSVTAYYIALALSEAAAVVAEAFILHITVEDSPRRAFLISFVLNCTSFFIGLAVG